MKGLRLRRTAAISNPIRGRPAVHIDPSHCFVIVGVMSEPTTKQDLIEFRTQINEDLRLHMGALYEKVSSDVSLLGEQLTALNKRLTVVESKVDVVIESVADLKVESTNRRERLLRLENRVNTLEAR